MKILAVIGAIQGLIFAGFIFSVKKNRAANLNLIAAVVFSAVQIGLFVAGYELAPSQMKFNVKLISLFFILPIPVFYYFYIRFLVEKSEYRKSDLLHLIPVLSAIASVFSLFFLPAEEKIAVFQNNDQSFIRIEIIHMSVIALLIIGYGYWGFSLLKNYRMGLRNIYSNVDDDEMIWLSSLMRHSIVIGKVGIIACLFGLSYNNAGILDLVTLWNAQYIIYCFAAVFLCWGSYNAMFHPEIFRELETVAVPPKEKYLNSILTVENCESLSKELSGLMNEQKLFLNPNLKLSDVAVAMNISNQILSQLLNQHFKKNFYDYVNDYRIETAKTNLLNPAFSNFTIQGIGQESGFKSKSTFYSLFKDRTGMTPAKFQKEAKGL